ncbi:MAG: hypothetical protein IKK36_12910 [Bacteroidales bacterium]|nr:hypothetical protein [Bacteroidales bacterium]
MNRNLLLLILLSVILFSCKDNTEPKEKFVYDYEAYKTQDILLAEEDRGKRFFNYQLANIDGKNVLILSMCRGSLPLYSSYLSFYDIESGEKIHNLVVDSLDIMCHFYFVGKDSIFINCKNLYYEKELQTPQALRLIDWDGNVKKIYGYDVDQTELRDYKYDINKLIPPQKEFVYCRGSIIFRSTYSTSYGLLGTKESVENPLPIGIRMDTKENKYHISKDRKYAYIKEGQYYPTNRPIWIRKTANDLPIFRYPYSSSAFEWDFENDSVIKHYFKSAFADSIMPLPYLDEFGNEIPYCYGYVEYDEYNQVYLSPIFFNEKIYGEPKSGLILADKNLLYLGDIYEPKYWPTVCNKDMTLNIRRPNDSTLTINYLKLVKTSCDYDKYIDSCRTVLQTMKQSMDDKKNALLDGCPPINFVNSQMNIKESSYKILTIHCNEGCTGCENAAIYTLLENKEVLNKVPLYIILSANNTAHLDSYIGQTGLSYFNKIALDSTGIMKSVANTSLLLNPRITVVNNGVVTLDTIYQALDIEDKLLPQITGPDEYTKYILDENGEVIVISKM